MTMSDVSVRTPKQKRSQESLERVLAASTKLLEENGFDRFTVQDVSQRAGVSVGAIYARFGSKESLLRAVHSYAMESLAPEHDALAAIDGRPARDVIADAVRAVAEIFHTNENLLRAFMHLGAVDDEIAKRGSESSTELAKQFEAAVLRHRDEITHREPEKAVDVAFRMAYCTFARQVMYGPKFESARKIRWNDLVDEVGAACAAYLLASDSSRRRRAR
jgi:AcrR family transcriptional regulator